MKPERLSALLERFKEARILVFGDLILDRYLIGSVDRISPEAPVPVVLIKSQEEIPGGAANVAGFLRALGASVDLCGVLGADEAGDLLQSLLIAQGIECQALIKEARRPTTIKTRVVAVRQQVVRIDREDASPFDPETCLSLKESFKSAIESGIDGLILSDYGKGLLTPDMIPWLIKTARKAGVRVAVDPKVRHFTEYRGVDLITPNNKEASEGIGIEIRDRETLLRAGAKIQTELDPDLLLITRSQDGLALFERGQAMVEIPARVREVYDVTGAGDMVIAVALLALVAGASPLEAASLANTAAGIEVSKFGCQPVSPAELLAAIELEG